DPWDRAGIEQLFKGLAEEYNAKLGDVIQPARVALTGTSVSPPIHDVIFILGRERTVERLRRGVDMASAALAASQADKHSPADAPSARAADASADKCEGLGSLRARPSHLFRVGDGRGKETRHLS